MEERGIAPLGVMLIAAGLYYLFATPGIPEVSKSNDCQLQVCCLVSSTSISPPLSNDGMRKSTTKSSVIPQGIAYLYVHQDNLVLGKKLGGGGFGLVYKAELVTENGKTIDAVVKKVVRVFRDRPCDICV